MAESIAALAFAEEVSVSVLSTFGGSQPPVTPVPTDWTPSSGLHEHCMHMARICKHTQILTNKPKTKPPQGLETELFGRVLA